MTIRPRSGRLRPLGLSEVQITGGFWGARQQINGTATLNHELDWVERTGWVENFRLAAEGRTLDRSGREFSDSEIYKLLEAVAWESARGGTPPDVADVVTTVGRAQEPNGYLSTAFGRPGQPAKYSNLEWGHELYCYGHLLHAGVAAARAGVPDLLDIARAAGDHVCETFGPTGNQGVCGHAGIEMALVELARETGEQRYLDQAAAFVDRRGYGRLADIELGREYYQDDVPVRAATILRGHAVRALYLACGAVDVAVETGDDELLGAVITQWEAAVARRTYLTGGMGSRHYGEAFGEDFSLPPDTAYSETCAGVASVMLSWRLLLATGDSRFADLAERTLFNVVATAVAQDGRAFFYANTLHQRTRGEAPDPAVPNPRPTGGVRSPWFSVSCCPTNVVRLLASLGGYVATTDSDGVQIHQYADADIATSLRSGPVRLAMRTEYPLAGRVTVKITEAPAEPIALTLRVPPWARDGATLTRPDGSVSATVGAGTVTVSRRFVPGDTVQLDLPVRPRWTVPDPRIDAIRGQVAVERGPLVMCLESPDLPGNAGVDAVRVDTGAEPDADNETVTVPGTLVKAGDAGWPYHGTNGGLESDRRDLTIPLVPYHAWANRGPSTMRVWIPTMT